MRRRDWLLVSQMWTVVSPFAQAIVVALIKGLELYEIRRITARTCEESSSLALESYRSMQRIICTISW
jgi:hypothetical protein